MRNHDIDFNWISSFNSIPYIMFNIRIKFLSDGNHTCIIVNHRYIKIKIVFHLHAKMGQFYNSKRSFEGYHILKT